MIKPKVTPPSAPDGEVTNRRSDVAHSTGVNDKRAIVQEHGNHADNYEGKPDVVKCPWKYESRIVNIPPSIVRTMQANVRNLCGLNGEEVKIRTCLSVQGSKLRVLFLAAFIGYNRGIHITSCTHLVETVDQYTQVAWRKQKEQAWKKASMSFSPTPIEIRHC